MSVERSELQARRLVALLGRLAAGSSPYREAARVAQRAPDHDPLPGWL